MAARQPTKPTWNAELRELRWGKQLVKKFKGPAANQELICAVFEEDKWAPRIDDPLPGGLTRRKRHDRLRDVIRRLNGHQEATHIHFCPDGRGKGVRWEKIWPTTALPRRSYCNSKNAG